ncbi:hypothetical protein CRYUN_Cryun08bG0103700 [Craigia yunnanensis]
MLMIQKTAVEVEALSWISQLAQGFPEEMRGQQQDRWSAYLELKTRLRGDHFHIHGKTTQGILCLTFSFKVHQVGLVSPVPQFLRENASRELVTQAVLSLFCQINHGAPEIASSLVVNDIMNTEGSSLAQPTMPHGAVVNPYSNASWGFKGNDSGNSSNEMPPRLGLGQISEPVNSQFFGRLELSQQNRRQYMELEHSRSYDTSTQHINWSICLLRFSFLCMLARFRARSYVM